MSPQVIVREREAVTLHRHALMGAALPSPARSKSTFLHGLLLPFTLIAATMRDRELRRPYLRVFVIRIGVVALFGALLVAEGDDSASSQDKPFPKGIHVGWSNENESAQPVTTEPTPKPDSLRQQKPYGSAWFLEFVSMLSLCELTVVLFSRRWDDWISHHASQRLAGILPEDATPKTPKLGFDLQWLFRKLKRRVRGALVFAAGLPVLFPLELIPHIGDWLFTVACTLWGWYWLGVFSAAKSAHAWADEGHTQSPAPIRVFSERVTVWPFRWYGGFWRWISRSIEPAAATFDRNPLAFLGLALGRVVLAFPGLYLLARPIIPVAAGRLCAEAMPEQFAASSAMKTPEGCK